MNQQGVRWSSEQVLALAPDDTSRKAGSKLGLPGPWSGAGADGAGAVWGLCGGSGGKPYRTVADTAGPAFRCSCPSRKFPCKHALGLLLLWAAEDPSVATGGAEPEWAAEWLEGRRERAAARKESAAGGEGGGAPADPEAAVRRAERRAGRITAGAAELERRLADLLRGGLASAEQGGYALWEETAARMVDAQAPGLAARVRELGAIPGSGRDWPVRLLEECALLHLLDTAWLRVERLPEPLAATVRGRVGLSTSERGAPIRDRWLILAQYDSSDGRVTTRRIWVRGEESGRIALVLSFGAGGRAPSLSLPVGLVVEADLSPYPGGGGLRADLGEALGPAVPSAAAPPGGPVRAAPAAYGRALAADPWLDAWPVIVSEVIPVPDGSGEGWQLADAGDGSALPVAPAALGRPGLWKLLALSGGDAVTVFGECGHAGLTPLAAWSAGTAGATALV
ncbi:SWIM zinc finger family protein [Streptomyces sp. CAU 1734]|uniref:SWIM zinc finger family protein n=1 Tax=Streptomyces sp. CAU 1734 TaxID=3140360 RepID=UPI00326193CF